MSRRVSFFISVLLILGAIGLHSASFQLNHAQAEPGGLLGIGSQTMGGKFLWSDEVVFHGWRIQKHAMIGHYRLLDDHDRRQERGTLETCLAKLDEIKQSGEFPPMPREVVIVLHGLGANRQFMNPLVEYLEQKGKLTVVNVGYPSTFGKIDEHALSLASVIQHLDGVQEISFVAHSMGNIVVRHYLNDVVLLTPAARPNVKFSRFVMITPPNHGAIMADKMGDSKLAQFAAGEPLEQLAPDKGWPTLERRLATPDFEFGIIAGGRGDEEGYLPFLPGDDDGLLTLETTELAGASDFIQIKGIHQLMPRNEQVQQVTLRFLKYGYFLPSGEKHPIPNAQPAKPTSHQQNKVSSGK